MMLVPRRNFDLFDDIFNDNFFEHSIKAMKTDIKEHDQSFELIIDLPGFDKNDIKMAIEDGYLTINAKTNSEDEEKNKKGKFVRQERYYGECTRSFYVGNDITEDDIKAKFKNGTLKIEIPKKEEQEKISDKKYIEIED